MDLGLTLVTYLVFLMQRPVRSVRKTKREKSERVGKRLWAVRFHKNARITIENIGFEPVKYFFYQITFALTDIPENCASPHARWRRENPLPKGEAYTILDDVKGQGHYVGTYMALGVNQTGWWGEGEIKFYIEGNIIIPPFVGLALRIILVEPGVLLRVKVKRHTTVFTPRPIWDFPKSSSLKV